MPSHLRLLGGNASKRPINNDEPKPPKGATEPPEWLIELDTPTAELKAMSVERLKDIAKRLDLKGLSKATKDRLVEAIGDVVEGDRLRFWRTIQSDLVQMGVMTKADGHALALLCDNLGRYVECQRFLRDNGLTYDFVTKMGVEMPLQRPEVGIAGAALTQALRLMDRFGLNPAYRTKLKVEAENPEEPLDKLRRRDGA